MVIQGASSSVATVFNIHTKVENSSCSIKKRIEIDIHADTNVLGSECLVIHDFGRPIKVKGYYTKDGSKIFPKNTDVVAYYQPQMVRTYLLVINQLIHLGHLEHNLLYSMQFHINQVNINEFPKFLYNDTNKYTHAIQVPYHLDDTV